MAYVKVLLILFGKNSENNLPFQEHVAIFNRLLRRLPYSQDERKGCDPGLMSRTFYTYICGMSWKLHETRFSKLKTIRQFWQDSPPDIPLETNRNFILYTDFRKRYAMILVEKL